MLKQAILRRVPERDMVNCSTWALEPVDDVLYRPSSLSCARCVGGGGIRDGRSIEVGVSRFRKKVMSYPPRPSGWRFVTSRRSQKLSSPCSSRRPVSCREGEKTNVVNTGCCWLSEKRVAFQNTTGFGLAKMSVRIERMKKEWQRTSGRR